MIPANTTGNLVRIRAQGCRNRGRRELNATATVVYAMVVELIIILQGMGHLKKKI